jgi:2-iminobutanoate/2-iminopropanoate deaminase
MADNESMSTPDATSRPTPLGPYTPVVSAGPFVVTSGQVGLIQTDSGPRLVDGGLEAQTRQAMSNVATVLSELGAGWPDVFKTTVYLTDIGGYAEFNGVYVELLGSHRPARSLVAVSALPAGALVEVEAWALRPGAA